MVFRRAAALAFFLVAPSASAQSRTDIAAAYGGTIPAACNSAYVDLANITQCRCVVRPPTRVVKGQTVISARDTCGDAIEHRTIANAVGLDVTVTPSPVQGGTPMTVVISIKNTSNADVPIVIGQPPWLRHALVMRDASGVDRARDEQCGSGYSSSLSTFLVVLPPAGIAEWRIAWQASTAVTDRACNPSWRPLASGTYALSVALQLMQIPNAIARGAMTVQ
jgi:hypothetical protein